MISLMKRIVPVEENRKICLESLSSLWQKSHFRDPPAETFPISASPLPSLSWKSCRLSPTISKLQQLYHQLPKWREKLLRTLPISTFAWRSIFSESNQGAAIEILLNSSRNFHISRSCGASNYHARSSIFRILMQSFYLIVIVICLNILMFCALHLYSDGP